MKGQAGIPFPVSWTAFPLGNASFQAVARGEEWGMELLAASAPHSP
jgi:hypothetical protein